MRQIMLSNKDYQLLHLNQQGYVIKCLCCDHFQLAFGSTMLIFTRQELFDFWQKTIIEIRLVKSCENPDMKQFQFQTPTPKVILVFTYNELTCLNDILEQACLSLEVQTMLSEIPLN